MSTSPHIASHQALYALRPLRAGLLLLLRPARR